MIESKGQKRSLTSEHLLSAHIYTGCFMLFTMLNSQCTEVGEIIPFLEEIKVVKGLSWPWFSLEKSAPIRFNMESPWSAPWTWSKISIVNMALEVKHVSTGFGSGQCIGGVLCQESMFYIGWQNLIWSTLPLEMCQCEVRGESSSPIPNTNEISGLSLSRLDTHFKGR